MQLLGTPVRLKDKSKTSNSDLGSDKKSPAVNHPSILIPTQQEVMIRNDSFQISPTINITSSKQNLQLKSQRSGMISN